MGIRDIDLNKDGVTLGDHLDKLKKDVDNLFDGDSSNSNNIFDRVTHQMKGSVISSKIDELNPVQSADNNNSGDSNNGENKQ